MDESACIPQCCLGWLDRFTVCIQRYKGHKELVLLVIPLEENPGCGMQVSSVSGQTPLRCDKMDDIAARDMALRAFPVGRVLQLTQHLLSISYAATLFSFLTHCMHCENR